MQDAGLDIPSFEFSDDFELDFSTPVASQSGLWRGGRAIPEPSDEGPGSFLLLYTITWKLQLRKGRIIKLTEDTIEDVEVAPGAYWNDVLESELATLVKSKVPEPQYQSDETTITVSNSKRGEPPFLKRFNKLTIDWAIVENKLRSWSNQGNNLKVAISFIYKECQPTNKDGKTGRGATKKQSAALDKLVAQQEASGTRAVWKDVYQLFECTSASCTNRGFSCWRTDNKHYKLDSDVMDQLVNYAEEGNELNTHADVPIRIRERVFTRRDEEEARRDRKRKASNSLPITVRVCCHGHHSDPAEGSDCAEVRGLTRGALIRRKFPMPRDEAPNQYKDWLCESVTNETWLASYRLASKVTIEKGYDLWWLYTEQKAGAEVLVANGVLEGIATQFVSMIKEWLDDVAGVECEI